MSLTFTYILFLALHLVPDSCIQFDILIRTTANTTQEDKILASFKKNEDGIWLGTDGTRNKTLGSYQLTENAQTLCIHPNKTLSSVPEIKISISDIVKIPAGINWSTVREIALKNELTTQIQRTENEILLTLSSSSTLSPTEKSNVPAGDNTTFIIRWHTPKE